MGESSFWYRPTRVVPDQRPLNGRCCCCCKGSREMCTLHLNKVYCLTSLSYGRETWTLNEQSIMKVNVAWSNSFRHIFGGFWRKSVKSLQLFCQTLPMTHFIDQRKLLFWSKLATHGNSFYYLFFVSIIGARSSAFCDRH